MRIELYHASKFGNGAMVAEEFKKVMAGRGVTVNVHHVDDSSPKEVPIADLYVFSSPGRMGKPIRGMRKFLQKLQLPPGSRYLLLVTELNPLANTQPASTTPDAELGSCQMVIPTMDEMLQEKGLRKVSDGKIFVTGMKGPLEEAWRGKVAGFVDSILASSPVTP